ncbi:bifunctional DNA-formamidopyrimidine glycosylase/DNA-(apurinic or apyrimidinic site) lyase [Thermaerobacter sp. PB12/4term]|uniref:bifunctional DNA-formamidopyrimidine glycosylase/DNA-(apurinic or apyrimidinic site) lyase n=1 Tax=Thermaerobacter sp. PB12/4term TaxID=2293838 RepID=UPI000E3254A7|nr:bifunctional DNA-formamidopyrimidine glycosylase/DNA-(apurinic or apyrimidinic site) lyase [Thermaerobacter sp. PB12/4term]QIA26446.1 bifunctional DNA-formamidopyrimidine glycosylase/DNA-(apurinic or apyrimidinic site) lyase [Thermaerobacter sp. PB12/4term]
MPELPEVETIRRDLEHHLAGARITRVHVLRPEVVCGAGGEAIGPEAFQAALEGARFRRFARRGKYLLIELHRPAGDPAARSGPNTTPVLPDEPAPAPVPAGVGSRAGGTAAPGAPGAPAGGQAPGGGSPPPAGGGSNAPAGPGRVAGGTAPTAGAEEAPAGRRVRPAGPGAGRLWLAIHLRMTGRLTLARRGEPRPPHTHVVFELEPGPGRPWEELRFSDVRRFGRLYLMPDNPLARARSRPAGRRAGREGTHAGTGLRGLYTLGPEPLSRRFGAAELGRRLAGRRAPIKAVLLDQRVVAGLGNIYADEALFRAGLHPARPAGSLTGQEVARLARAIRGVLREAVAAGGTTFSDYRDGLGREGRFARRLAVYDREGHPCPRCGTPVAALRLAGRTSHYCPRCQPSGSGWCSGPRGWTS